jgi:hypothetical protein
LSSFSFSPLLVFLGGETVNPQFLGFHTLIFDLTQSLLILFNPSFPASFLAQ